ncbi:uncharacterized protein ColSpa_03608 [Colletotrichum spaethianum]|uniref:Uncharacterized protein n=1 Tax=Colletotrichum spaethianum TaxID=700344 RepID=A0AA37L7W5_9PEZI|nr:uncharacterized protein ColSpa_03608 [Colletotrichum spaethianum]GKT43427.1 hypothetical protein ColSpa_03608 [Colletotrichum spaethianum]
MPTHYLSRLTDYNFFQAADCSLQKEKSISSSANDLIKPSNRAWFPSLWNIAIDALNTIPKYTDVDGLTALDDTQQADFAGVTSVQLIPIAVASIDMIGHFGYNAEFNTINTMASNKLGSAARHAKH